MRLLAGKEIRNREGNIACKVGRWEGHKAVVVSIKKGHCITYIVVFPNLDVRVMNYTVRPDIG